MASAVLQPLPIYTAFSLFHPVIRLFLKTKPGDFNTLILISLLSARAREARQTPFFAPPSRPM
jgi:hypothetical protein